MLRQFNFLNIFVMALSIFAGYSVVSVASAAGDHQMRSGGMEEMVRSTARIADSFEFYNQRKFASNAP